MRLLSQVWLARRGQGGHRRGLSLLETAIVIVVEAHADKKDKAGQPYIIHPLRVRFRVEAGRDWNRSANAKN